VTGEDPAVRTPEPVMAWGSDTLDVDAVGCPGCSLLAPVASDCALGM